MSVSGAEHWLEAFDRHLEHVAGVSAGRRKNCLRIARCLLEAAFGNMAPDFSQLRAEHVSAFVQARAAKRAPTCRKDPGSAVLTFLRFLSTAESSRIICHTLSRVCGSGRTPPCHGF